MPADTAAVLSRRRGTGQALPSSVAGPIGEAMGADFGGVRVHADGEADRISRSVQATAFTHGQDIYFTQGTYAPSSASGQRLLAHELAHVAQNQTSASGTGPGPTIGHASDPAESAADAAADSALSSLRRHHARYGETAAVVRAEGRSGQGEMPGAAPAIRRLFKFDWSFSEIRSFPADVNAAIEASRTAAADVAAARKVIDTVKTLAVRSAGQEELAKISKHFEDWDEAKRTINVDERDLVVPTAIAYGKRLLAIAAEYQKADVDAIAVEAARVKAEREKAEAEQKKADQRKADQEKVDREKAEKDEPVEAAQEASVQQSTARAVAGTVGGARKKPVKRPKVDKHEKKRLKAEKEEQDQKDLQERLAREKEEQERAAQERAQEIADEKAERLARAEARKKAAADQKAAEEREAAEKLAAEEKAAAEKKAAEEKEAAEKKAAERAAVVDEVRRAARRDPLVVGALELVDEAELREAADHAVTLFKAGVAPELVLRAVQDRKVGRHAVTKPGWAGGYLTLCDLPLATSSRGWALAQGLAEPGSKHVEVAREILRSLPNQVSKPTVDDIKWLTEHKDRPEFPDLAKVFAAKEVHAPSLKSAFLATPYGRADTVTQCARYVAQLPDLVAVFESLSKNIDKELPKHLDLIMENDDYWYRQPQQVAALRAEAHFREGTGKVSLTARSAVEYGRLNDVHWRQNQATKAMTGLLSMQFAGNPRATFALHTHFDRLGTGEIYSMHVKDAQGNNGVELGSYSAPFTKLIPAIAALHKDYYSQDVEASGITFRSAERKLDAAVTS